MNIRLLKDEEKHIAQKLAMEVFLNSDGLGFSEQGMHSVFSFIEETGALLDYLGAFEKEELIGMLAFDPETYHLALCFVSKQYQQKGIGHQLLQAFIELAKKNGIARITVNSAPSAKGVYEDFGFEVCGKEEERDGVRSIPMEYLLSNEWLGKTVTVTVDRPYGSMHEHYPDTPYTCNYGYVEEALKTSGDFLDAYVFGVKEPVEQFTGVVVAVVYRSDDIGCRLVVSKEATVDPVEVINAIGFIEQNFDVRIEWLKA